MAPIAHLPLLLLLAQATETDDAGADPPGSDLVIVSNSNCPSAQEVREALARLRPPDEWPEAAVTIRARDQSLSIEVGGGSVKRELAVGPDCAASSGAAALVIATWMDDLPAEVAGAPLLRAPVVTEEAAAQEPERPAGYELGAAVGAAAGGGVAPGVRAEVVRLPGRGPVGVLAGLTIMGPRDVSVGQGVSRWLRTSALLGLHARRSAERHFIAADLGLGGAITTAWGSGYTANSSDHSLTWGPVAGLRAGVPWGRFRLWAELRGAYWVKGDSVRLDSPSTAWIETVPLPSWEAQAALGLAYAVP